MKQITCSVLVLSCVAMLTACASGGGVYRHYHGLSPWYNHYGYYRDGGVIVVPDVPVVEATTPPSGPEMMPDMGMPAMDMGMDMDF
jgi:hypothetical protein